MIGLYFILLLIILSVVICLYSYLVEKDSWSFRLFIAVAIALLSMLLSFLYHDKVYCILLKEQLQKRYIKSATTEFRDGYVAYKLNIIGLDIKLYVLPEDTLKIKQLNEIFSPEEVNK